MILNDAWCCWCYGQRVGKRSSIVLSISWEEAIIPNSFPSYKKIPLHEGILLLRVQKADKTRTLISLPRKVDKYNRQDRERKSCNFWMYVAPNSSVTCEARKSFGSPWKISLVVAFGTWPVVSLSSFSSFNRHPRRGGRRGFRKFAKFQQNYVKTCLLFLVRLSCTEFRTQQSAFRNLLNLTPPLRILVIVMAAAKFPSFKEMQSTFSAALPPLTSLPNHRPSRKERKQGGQEKRLVYLDSHTKTEILLDTQ